jgi:hypothetical protein
VGGLRSVVFTDPGDAHKASFTQRETVAAPNPAIGQAAAFFGQRNDEAGERAAHA